MPSPGAHGVVPGLGNVDPHGYLRLYDAAGNGQWDAVRAEQQRLTRLFTIIEVPDTTRIGPISAALGAFKAALTLRGVIAHAGTLPPLLPLLPAEVDKIAAVMAGAGIPGAGGK